MAAPPILTIAEVDAFEARLRSLVASLSPAGPAPRSDSLLLSPAPPRRERRRPGRPPGRQMEDAAAAVLRLLLSSESGLRMSALIAGAGGNGFRVKRAIARLREAGRIRMTGMRNTARYFAAR